MKSLNNMIINKDRVLKFLGYGDRTPSKKILSIIDEEVLNCKKYLKPSLFSKILNIKNINEEEIILENNIILYGKTLSDKLKNCNSLSVTIATVGEDINSIINNYLNSRQTMRALIADKISIVALDHIVTINQKDLSKKVSLNGDNIISKISTGDPAFPIENQKYIFDILQDINTEITLNEFYVMTPVKTTAFILGIGKGEPLKCNNCCSTCPNPCEFS